MGQNSAIKSIFRFKRGSAAKTPSGKSAVGSPSKIPAAAPAGGVSPAKRLFTFSPGPARTAGAKTSTTHEAAAPQNADGDLIRAARIPTTAATAAAASELPPVDDGSAIRVVVRVRPRNEREAAMGGAICVQRQDAGNLRLIPPAEPHAFGFDHVLAETASQADAFEVAGRPIVANSLRGYNGCLFAYGQTGSGKTHTMLGGDAGAVSGDVESRGLIQRIFEEIFEAAEAQAGDGVTTRITCSFLEIYNETLSDLLGGGSNLALREDGRRGGGVFVEGLSAEAVRCTADVEALLARGAANRRVGETAMNERSSRSHSVFTATVERRTPGAAEGMPDTVLRSRLHLVDLAGSERQKATGAAGERLREASSINKSLSALGLVIKSLVDLQSGRQCHVPYRDSKLTTLLRDSLGGNAKTVMVACVSPAAVNAAETLSTLRFADSAKRIKNNAVMNEDAEGDAETLRREVRRLKEELAAARRGGVVPTSGEPVTPRGAGLGLDEDRPMPTTAGAGGGEGVRRALVGALRREEAAAAQVAALQEELEGMRGLVAAKDADLQRTQMMLKLKESRLARGAAAPIDGPAAALAAEVDLLKAKLEAHPEVKRFAVENLHLAHEVERLQAALDRRELEALEADVAALRRQILGLAEAAETAQEEAARAAAEAEAARAVADAESAAARDAYTKLREHEDAPELRARIESLESENAELRMAAEGAAAAREEAAKMCDHAAGLEAQCEGLKAELEARVEASNAAEATYKGTTEELAAAWDQLSAAEAELAAVKQEHAAALEAIQEEHNRVLDGMKKEHEAALSQAAAALEAALADAEGLRREVQAAHARCAELEAERQSAVEEVAAKEAALAAAAEELQAEKRRSEEASDELEKLKDDLKSANNNASDLASRLEAATADLKTTRAKVASLEAGAAKAEVELADVRSQLASARSMGAALTDAVAQREREMATEAARHTAEVEALQAELREVEDAKTELDYELSDKSASLAEAREALAAARAAAAAAKSGEETAAAQIKELNAALIAAREAGSASEQACRALKTRVALAEAAAREAREELETARCGPLEMEQQLREARAAMAEERTRTERARTEAASLAASLRKRDEEMGRLRSEMKAEVDDAAAQVQELLAAQARAAAAEERAAALARRMASPPGGVGGRQP